MAREYQQQIYEPIFPEKYVGTYPIRLKSSWEIKFAQYADNHPDVLQWAYEPVSIPYANPVKGSQSIYIPDFLITVISADKQTVTKLVEIKPIKEKLVEYARNEADLMIQAVNRAKWGAAQSWCMRRGIEFLVLDETGMFAQAGNMAPTKFGARRSGNYAAAQSLPKKTIPGGKSGNRTGVTAKPTSSGPKVLLRNGSTGAVRSTKRTRGVKST